MKISINAKNAIYLGTLCSISYLAVYIVRNVLGIVTPQMIESGKYTAEYIGKVSSLYFIFYAVGQLINGILGDRIKARYMIAFGLALAGITNIVFPYMSEYPNAGTVVYGMTGFFLAMIYAPMTKVVAENTEPIHATRCSIGYTFASLFGSPLAGVIATFCAWQNVFTISSVMLFVMAIICFGVFLGFEQKGIINYQQYKKEEHKGGEIRILLQQHIMKYTLVAILTGIVRTTVVFWLPTYVSHYLHFSANQSAMIFTIATLFISLAAFIAFYLYEALKRDRDLTVGIMFVATVLFFMLVYFVKQPVWNIVFMVLAIIAANAASTILWSVYCPGLRDTGLVSSVTGYLDFVSYVAASISSTLFANAVSNIGWENLILVWVALAGVGVIIFIPDMIRKRK